METTKDSPRKKTKILYRGISMSVPKMWGKQMLKSYQIWRIPPSPSLSFPPPFNEEEREGGRGPLKYLQQRAPKKWAHLPPSFFSAPYADAKKVPPQYNAVGGMAFFPCGIAVCRIWMQ